MCVCGCQGILKDNWLNGPLPAWPIFYDGWIVVVVVVGVWMDSRGVWMDSSSRSVDVLW